MNMENQESFQFSERLRQSLLDENRDSSDARTDKHSNVNSSGEVGNPVYFIESRLVKLVIGTSGGRECLLAICRSGNVFGEQYLSGIARRQETVTAMEDTFLSTIPRCRFLERLTGDSLLEVFVKYLARRVADQEQIIANLVIPESGRRLGNTL